ncbi:stalk domain-containing protein [Paenibacillus aestuarii]|uniref:Stalk domain-containing protein n=1 Tax=Paenibacillus aestuarii TaxID=516965 RepID=A0ABW0KEL7_9BACL|nr:stalk domain-containing protein [Paenibacillus aestuarii]
MKSFKYILIPSLVAVVCLAGSPVSAASAASTASLSGDALLTGSGRIMADVTTLAGIGDFDAKDGDALDAAFRAPSGILQLADGSILVADSRNQTIRRIANGQVTTYAGPALPVATNSLGFPKGYLLDGKSSAAFFDTPTGLSADAKGQVYVADAGNNAIRKIDANGQVTTLAGSGVLGNEDGQGGKATFNHPSDVAVAPDGTVYVADTLNHLIRKITPNGAVTTLNAASTRAVQVRPGEAAFAGDYEDGPLSAAKFNEPSGLALDSQGNLFVSDAGNQCIRYIDLQTNTVTTLAGKPAFANGSSIYGKNELYAPGDYTDGAALQARFDYPKGLAVTSEGGLLIADSLNHAIRYLFHGQVTTIAGTMQTGEADGVEQAASFYAPTDVLVTAQGNIVAADTLNNKIRVISPYHLPQDLAADDQVKVVNGHTRIQFDAQPEIRDGRTMVPVRAISEAFGYEVKYVQREGGAVVQLIKGDVTVELTIGQTGVMRKQGNSLEKTQETDAAPYVKEGRTFVPVRFFAEQIGLNVQWDAPHRTAILRTNSYLD